MKWNSNLIDTGMLAVHAALLHTGEIILFTGNEFWGQEHNGLPPDYQPNYHHVRLFNCHTLAVSNVPIPTDMTDLFCCGHAFFGNGNLMIAGGTKEITDPDPNNIHHQHNHWIGETSTWLYDPISKQFMHCASLNLYFDPVQHQFIARSGGRWYPTLVTLPSGQILAIGGHPDKDDPRHSANIPEFFEWNSWTYVDGDCDPDINLPDKLNPLEYPRLHLLPDGTIFSATPFDGNKVMFYEFNRGWKAFADLTPNNSDWRDTLDRNERIYNEHNGTSVMLPLLPENNYETKVMVHGNTNSYIINLSGPTPLWEKTSMRLMNKRRLTCNSVILPTGEIFFTGGVEGSDAVTVEGPSAEFPDGRQTEYPDTTGVLEAEIYNPANNTWTLTPPAQVVRNYHSVALLMPDGRVWTAGSSKHHLWNGNVGPVPPNPDYREMRIELFEPWYYGLPTRPKINAVVKNSASGVLKLGETFVVLADKPHEISRVAIIRNGSVTHAFNSDQRYIGLSFKLIDYPIPMTNKDQLIAKPEQVLTPALQVSIPDNANIVVPGYYLLFLIDKHGVPSEGEFINVNVGWSDWTEGEDDKCISAPSIMYIQGRLDVFVKREADSSIWHKWRTGNAWSGWENLGGRLSSAPAAVSWGDYRMDLFAKGMDSAVWHKWWDGSSWHDWESLGGTFNSAPCVASWSANRLDVFAMGTDSAIRHKWWDGSSWNGWENLGGTVSSAPAAVSWGENRIDLFAKGMDSAIWHKWWDGSSWNGWESLGWAGSEEEFQSAPTVSSFRNNRLDLFAIGINNHLWHRWWDGNSWNFWEDLGGNLIYSPSAASGSFNSIDVIGVNDKGNLVHKYWWR